MNDSSIGLRRMQVHAGYLLIEYLAEQARKGRQAVSGWMAAFAAARRSRQARYELRRLSDRSLRDIGLERDQIERLFR